MIESNGAEDRLSWMPARENCDLRACISWLVTTAPLPNLRVKLRGVPALMPAPHWPLPVPGLTQVLVPFGVTFQPLSVSSLTAVLGLNGHGPLVS